MSSQHRVQRYLENHGIGKLFEDLMARLIRDLPDEPIHYLMKVLNKMDERSKIPYQENPPASKSRPPSGSTMRKTVSGTGVTKSYSDYPRPKSSGDVMRRSTGSVSQWASTDYNGVKKGTKNYDKPWMTNKKKEKPQTLTRGTMSEEQNTRPARKAKKQDWDPKFKGTSHTFDEMFQTKGTSKPSNKSTWAAQDDEELLYKSSGYRGVQRRSGNDEDPLAGELVIAKSRPQQVDDEGYGTPTKLTCRHVSQGNKSNARKKDLEKYLKSQQKVQRSEVIHGDDLDEYDEAIDMLENVDDLLREGATNVKASGHKISKTYRQPPVEPQVRVSICARCAKIIGTGQPSEPARDFETPQSYGELIDYDDNQSDYPSARHFAPINTDDEFESVSQVHSPRRPVWHDDDNFQPMSDTYGPRQYSVSPERSRRIDSGYIQDRDDGSKQYGSTSIEGGNQAWAQRTYRSDTEDDGRLVKSDQLLHDKGRSWQTPISDDEESIDWDRDRVGNSTRFQTYGGSNW